MKKAIFVLFIFLFLFMFSFYSCKESVNQDTVIEKNALQNDNSNSDNSSSGSTQSSYYNVSGLQIYRDEPITYEFASVDEFKQKMINKDVKTYKPIEIITVPANSKITDKINQVIYFYYENTVEYIFDKNNDYHLYSISVTMYPPEEYSNQEVFNIMTRNEFEQQTENLESYAKVKEIGNTKYHVTKIYSKKYNQTDLRVSTIINETYILNISFIMDGNVDFNDSVIKDIIMESIKV